MSRGQLRFHAFNSATDPLVQEPAKQAVYLRWYLADLGAKAIVEEPVYFDRDYLAEFSAFYATSVRGYPNHCRRLHFFASPVDEAAVTRAASGDEPSLRSLQDSYIGFVVLRPIPAAPLGRTVLRWYDDHTPARPRVTTPSRSYECHIAGCTLRVSGVAWQQQDAGVGACATIALWSALHSSAFDDHHAIPTTAQITRYAHRRASLTSRLFPSDGLTVAQICDAIKEAGLEPVVHEGDLREGRSQFSRARFNSTCAALLRCGYPSIILAYQERPPNDAGHAVCLVGFREPQASEGTPGKVTLHDEPIEFLYIHDDNLGPNVRFRVEEHPVGPRTSGVRLQARAPKSIHGLVLPEDPSPKYPRLVPATIVAAVHEDLRTTPDVLHRKATELAYKISGLLKQLVASKRVPKLPGVTVSTRFARLHRYMGDELATVLGAGPLLGRVRMAIAQDVEPMSLFVGVVRVGIGREPVADFLFDTTDSARNLRIFCTVCFTPILAQIFDGRTRTDGVNWGVKVEAFE